MKINVLLCMLRTVTNVSLVDIDIIADQPQSQFGSPA